MAIVALARRGRVRRCYGDVGDAMAQQGDEGARGEQWPWRDDRRRLFLLHSIGTQRREARAWARDVEATQGTDLGGSGSAVDGLSPPVDQ
jgi:hypothetical protein